MKSFSNGRVHGHGFYDRTAPSITQLSVLVSELHAGENGRLELTCMATIPAFISHKGQYADLRTQTVIGMCILFDKNALSRFISPLISLGFDVVAL